MSKDKKIKELEQRVLDQKNKLDLYEARFYYIWAIGFDYDGYYNNSQDLRDVIDELVDIANGKKDEELKVFIKEDN